MKKKSGEWHKKPGGGQSQRTEKAEDFGISPDYSYRVRYPSANDIYREVTVTLPYIGWLGRERVTHENN
jgi:hypothetical protein